MESRKDLQDLACTHLILALACAVGMFNNSWGISLLSAYFGVTFIFILYQHYSQEKPIDYDMFQRAVVWPCHALRWLGYVFGTLYVLTIVGLDFLFNYSTPITWKITESIDLWLWNYMEETGRAVTDEVRISNRKDVGVLIEKEESATQPPVNSNEGTM